MVEKLSAERLKRQILSLYLWRLWASCRAGKNLAPFLVSLFGRKIQWLSEKWHSRTYEPVQQHLCFQGTEIIMLGTTKYPFRNSSEAKTFGEGRDEACPDHPEDSGKEIYWGGSPPMAPEEGIPSAEFHLQCLPGELLNSLSSGGHTEHISWKHRRTFNI